MGKVMAVAAALLLAACSSGPNYADPNYRPPQQMDPNAAALMMMYGVEQFGRSIQPQPAPQAQGVRCYGGRGYMWCQ